MKHQDNHLQNIINETIKRQINEAIMLNSESNSLQNVIITLQKLYNRLTQRGVSKNEVTITKIAKMIQDLRIIQKHWQNIAMW